MKEGQQIRLDGETVYLADAVVAKGTWQTAESVASDMAVAKDGLAEQLRAFVTNTFEYINRDSELLAEGIRMPDLKTKLAAGTPSSSRAATGTTRISRHCAPISGSSSRSSSPSMAARTR